MFHSPVCALICISAGNRVIKEEGKQTDLHGKVFVFPKASATAHVILKPRLEQPLRNVSVCLRFGCDLTRAYSLFSYATKDKDNDFLLFKPKPGELRLYVGGEPVTFKVPERTGTSTGWEHVCASWESATGIAELWVNGSPLPRKGLQKGYSVSDQGVLVLGQEQDNPGGGFDMNQSFVGEITDVYMWETLLSPDEVSLAMSNGVLPHLILDWRTLSYETKHYVVIKPSLLPVY
ncbi:mitochondrial carrier-like protein 2 [Platysternon megacephalum]|uniref:Pentraxin family member n=1 Tax=Platysternon megacephalum TaxID=55544 RepID=A0A4D9DRS0_9SAUR|nr:mitochondrial carrier-like protein 2 [Platysternon megacephalum]